MHALRGRLLALVIEAAHGAWLGLVILGVGGRAAMRVVAIERGERTGFTLDGSLSVVAMGVAAGAAGAVLHALARLAARAVMRAFRIGTHRGIERALRVALFGGLLVLATARGLHGAPPPTHLFWWLVAAYGVALDVVLAGAVEKRGDADRADPAWGDAADRPR